MALNLILASGSPRRKELLAFAGFDFQVITSDCDESYDPTLPPQQVAPILAQLKAQAVAAALPHPEGHVIVGADTIVTLNGRIYGKPKDTADAHKMLAELSGCTHQVMTGVCVIAPQGTQSFVEVTDVTFRTLTAAEIETYIATGEPFDKAGAYGIQGEGGKLVAAVDGDFDNVVGLPISRLTPKLNAVL